MTLFLILGCFGSKAKDTLQNAQEYFCATPWQPSSDANMASSSSPSMIRVNGHEEGLGGMAAETKFLRWGTYINFELNYGFFLIPGSSLPSTY